jgi:hypothetical protein
MTNVMSFDTFREQSLTTPLSAACEGGAPAFGAHAGTKTVLALPCSLGWLISAFHKAGTDRDAILRAVTVGASRALSIVRRAPTIDLPFARTLIL